MNIKRKGSLKFFSILFVLALLLVTSLGVYASMHVDGDINASISFDKTSSKPEIIVPEIPVESGGTNGDITIVVPDQSGEDKEYNQNVSMDVVVDTDGSSSVIIDQVMNGDLFGRTEEGDYIDKTTGQVIPEDEWDKYIKHMWPDDQEAQIVYIPPYIKDEKGNKVPVLEIKAEALSLIKVDTLIIPNTVIKIGRNTFERSQYYLKRIVILSDEVPEVEKTSFGDNFSGIDYKIYVPVNKFADYAARIAIKKDNWSTFYGLYNDIYWVPAGRFPNCPYHHDPYYGNSNICRKFVDMYNHKQDLNDLVEAGFIAPGYFI